MCFCLQDQLIYELIGSESAMRAFFVNPDNGLISLKRSLAETVDATFTVSAVYTVINIINIV